MSMKHFKIVGFIAMEAAPCFCIPLFQSTKGGEVLLAQKVDEVFNKIEKFAI